MNTAHDEAPSLAGLDLNLITSFDALVRERSVTRAALRVGVTQSAMSHALRRLRELLADPVLIRTGSGMVLTPRAEALAVPVRSALLTLGRALAEPDRFEPSSSTRAFTLATPDLFDVVMIPPLLARLRVRAPNASLAAVPLDHPRLAERLETGETDVAAVPQVEEQAAAPPLLMQPGLVRRTLLRDRFLCFIREGHPALGPRRRRTPPALTLEAYAGLGHALVTPGGTGRGLVDALLERHGLARRIVLRVPHFYSALAIVGQSDLVLTAPAVMAQLLPAGAPVVALAPPLRLPRHSLNLVWHERFTKDAGHTWLRELVAETTRATQRDA